jgi:HTH-type transcriptional regulator/antitoxin HigA
MASIRPIKTVADYNAALAEIDRLWDAKPDTPAADRLDVLTTLVEVYEAEHYPIDPPDPIEALKFRMEQQGLDRADLQPYIGSRARIAEILNGKRSLTLAMIRRLHDGLGIPLESLIQPSKRRRHAA